MITAAPQGGSNQPQPLQAGVPVLADDDVVVHRDAERAFLWLGDLTSILWLSLLCWTFSALPFAAMFYRMRRKHRLVTFIALIYFMVRVLDNIGEGLTQSGS